MSTGVVVLRHTQIGTTPEKQSAPAGFPVSQPEKGTLRKARRRSRFAVIYRKWHEEDSPNTIGTRGCSPNLIWGT